MNESVQVFIVDGDAATRKRICELAASLQVESLGYSSAEEFLAALGTSGRGCLVTEACLPDMSGLELVDIMSRRAYRIPVIVFTGFADIPLAVRGMHAGALAVLQKPGNPEELQQAILRALQTGRRWWTEHTRVRTYDEGLEALSLKERRVLEQVLLGKTSKEIASALAMGLRTVEAHRQAIMSKLGVTSLVELVQRDCEWRSADGERRLASQLVGSSADSAA
jgi:two-component system, LuxR family, response regulator FixJ